MVKKIVPLVTALILVALLLCAFPPQPAEASPDWWDINWQYRMKLTFDNTASSENLADFPVLVHLTSTHLDFWLILIAALLQMTPRIYVSSMLMIPQNYILKLRRSTMLARTPLSGSTYHKQMLEAALTLSMSIMVILMQLSLPIIVPTMCGIVTSR